MPTYSYKVRDRNDKEINGFIVRGSEPEVRSELSSLGYTIVDITFRSSNDNIEPLDEKNQLNKNYRAAKKKRERDADARREQDLSNTANNLNNAEQATGGESAWTPVAPIELNSGSSGGSSGGSRGGGNDTPPPDDSGDFDPDKTPPLPPNKGNSGSSGSSDDNKEESLLEKILEELKTLTKNTEEQKKAIEKDTHYEQDMRKYEQYRDETEYNTNFAETMQGAMEAVTPLGGSGKNMGELFSNLGDIGQGVYSKYRQLNRPYQPKRENYTPQGNRLGSPEAQEELRRKTDDTELDTSTPPPKTPKKNKSKSKPSSEPEETKSGGDYPPAPDPIKGGGAPVAEEIGAGAEGEAIAGTGAIPGIGEIVLFVAAISEATKAAYAFAYAQEGEVRKLAEVGGSQAAAVAVLDANRIGRQVSTANETSQSSEKLIDALDKLEEVMRPFEAILTNIANTLGTEIASELTLLLSALKLILIPLDGLYRFLTNEKKQEEVQGLDINKWDMLNQIRQENEKSRNAKWPSGS